MSNWCDVRVRLKCRNIDIAETVCNKLKKIAANATHTDRNNGVYLGSDYFKFVWTSVKRMEDTVYILSNFRVGFTDNDFADIIRWLYPDVDSVELQIRDDDSRIFGMFKWRMDSANYISVKLIEPENYPKICEDDREMVACLHAAVKQSSTAYVAQHAITK